MNVENYKQKLLEQLSLEELQQLVSLEASLKNFDDESTVKEQIPYVGKDGEKYYSYKELISADEKYFQTQSPYVGEDGKPCSTMGELINANIRYWNFMRIIKNINDIEKSSSIVANNQDIKRR